MDDASSPSSSRGRVFLHIRDWIEAHKRGISSALYLTAGLSLWILKRSVQDYRVNRIRRVEDVPESLFKRKAKLSGVVASVDLSSGVLFFYHVPLLHRLLRFFLPIPLLVPRASSSLHVVSPRKRDCYSSGDPGGISTVKLTSVPFSSSTSSLLPLCLHSVDVVPLRKDRGSASEQSIARGHRGTQDAFSSYHEGDRGGERGGCAVARREPGDRRNAVDTMHALKTFLDEEILQQPVSVTLIDRDVKRREVNSSEQEHEREGGRRGREPTDPEQRGGKLGSSGGNQPMHKDEMEGPETGKVAKNAPWFNSLRFCVRRHHFDNLFPSSPLRVRLQFAKKNIFDIRRYDLEEELLRQGFAVVAHERLREEEQQNMTAQRGFSSLLPFRRWRAKQRIRKLEALEARARELGRGIWATGSQEDAHDQTTNSPANCASVPASSLVQGRSRSRKTRNLVPASSFFFNSMRRSFCSSSPDPSASPGARAPLRYFSLPSSSSPCYVSDDVPHPLRLRDAPAARRRSRLFHKTSLLSTTNCRLRAAPSDAQNPLHVPRPDAALVQPSLHSSLRFYSTSVPPCDLRSPSRSSRSLLWPSSFRPSSFLQRGVVSTLLSFETSRGALGRNGISRRLAGACSFSRGVMRWLVANQ